MKKKIKRIIQALPNFSRKDAIGEETLLIDSLLKSSGWETDILTLSLDIRSPVKDWSESVILYHYSIGSRLPYYFLDWKAPFFLRFHNITPPQYFSSLQDSEQSTNACQLGLQQMRLLVRNSLYSLPTSNYNEQMLQKYSIDHNSTVIPVIRDYSRFQRSDYEQPKQTQFLFVGRLSPNKCQNELVEFLSLYKKTYDPKARLVLVGKPFSKIYFQALIELVKSYSLKVAFDLHTKDEFDVLFVNSLTEEDLVRVYHQSSLFLSMSEHEGFCVPLIEAMNAKIPVLAHKASAIPETLGSNKFTFDKNNKEDTLKRIQQTILYPEDVLDEGIKRAEYFSFKNTSSLLKKTLKEYFG